VIRGREARPDQRARLGNRRTLLEPVGPSIGGIIRYSVCIRFFRAGEPFRSMATTRDPGVHQAGRKPDRSTFVCEMAKEILRVTADEG